MIKKKGGISPAYGGGTEVRGEEENWRTSSFKDERGVKGKEGGKTTTR